MSLVPPAVPFVERFFIDIEEKLIGAITPSPAFRMLLLDGVLKHNAQAPCRLLSPEQRGDWAEWWSWWRRGRIELPVQRRAALRFYRRIRRFRSRPAGCRRPSVVGRSR